MRSCFEHGGVLRYESTRTSCSFYCSYPIVLYLYVHVACRSGVLSLRRSQHSGCRHLVASHGRLLLPQRRTVRIARIVCIARIVRIPQYTRCQYIPFTVRCMGPWAHTLPYRYLRKIRASVPCGTFTFGDLGTPVPYPYLGTEGNRIQFPPTVQTP